MIRGTKLLLRDTVHGEYVGEEIRGRFVHSNYQECWVALLASFFFMIGCGGSSPSDSKMTGTPTCDPSIATMTTGSQAVIGTRTITKITNASGQSVQATSASGCSSVSSVCEVPAGLYTVGGSFSGQPAGGGVGPIIQLGLVDGPSNGQCSEDQSVTVDTNKVEEMAVSTVLTEDPGSPYVVYITAIWPAS